MPFVAIVKSTGEIHCNAVQSKEEWELFMHINIKVTVRKKVEFMSDRDT